MSRADERVLAILNLCSAYFAFGGLERAACTFQTDK